MRIGRPIALGLMALMLTACDEGAPTAGTPTAFDAACDKANDGKRLALTGYLRLPDSFKADGTVLARLYQQNDFKGTPIAVSMKFGSEPNQLASVGDQFKDSDLNVRLAGGQSAGFGTRVKVSGKIYFPVAGIANVEFTCGVTNPLVELAQ
jgi:hypothetical protein